MFQESDKLKEDDLYKFLLDLKRPCSALKKLKCIPGSLKLDISPYSGDLKYALTPELSKIAPYPGEFLLSQKKMFQLFFFNIV